MSPELPAKNQIHRAFPYLRCRDAHAAIKFYCDVFGARETFRLAEPSGRIGHAELQLGPIVLMVSDEYPEYGIYSPLEFGGTGMCLHLHVDNADELASRAVAAGAKLIMPPTDQFYGERSAKVLDPFGHEWLLGHEIEKLSNDEIQRRFTEMCGSSS